MKLLKETSNWISMLLSCLLLWNPASAAVQAEGVPSSIQLLVIEGEGAINRLGERAAREPIVEVQDDNRRPLAGVAVVFTLPTQGPSGEFSNGSQTLTVLTDEQGRAVATGLRLNRSSGKLPIRVNASYKGLTARAVITQFNMAVPGMRTGHSSGKLILILGLIGAAAAGGVIAATQRGGSSSGASQPSSTAIGITPGTGSVGAPR
ncbi:MAG TPA: hypothetical protein VG672_28335 [Bryobacteraceae bacterium]|nr:hypothetical protein [Bryobacteraceae bacterium]